jgi:hypothetical protein
VLSVTAIEGDEAPPLAAGAVWRSARLLLEMRVTTRGIDLGWAVDLVLNEELDRALGLDVVCVDRQHRFVPWFACRFGRTVEVRNALSLMDAREASFYRAKGSSLRTFLQALGGSNSSARDVLLDGTGSMVAVTLGGSLERP